MVNRQRFLLDDLDSEGFPIPKPRDPLPLLALNIGRLADHGMVQALLADYKCLGCTPPRDNVGLYDVQDHLNWVEEARQIVRDADTLMLSNHDGITRLSDSYAPEAYFGHKR